MNNQNKYYLTPEQKEEFKNQLEHLTNIAIPENAIAINKAKALGDLSENAEYSSAKDEQAKLHQEKSKLQNILNNSIIIQKSNSNETVELGHFVTIEWIETNQEETIQLLGYGNGEDKISSDSPLGKALLNKRAGETITYKAPKMPLTLKILKIQ